MDKPEGGLGDGALADAVQADRGIEDEKAGAYDLRGLRQAPAVVVIVETRRGGMLFCLPGKHGLRTMVKPVSDFISHVREAFEDYQAEVEASNLAPASKVTYLRHAETFVRWMEGGFQPGAQVPGAPKGNAR